MSAKGGGGAGGGRGAGGRGTGAGRRRGGTSGRAQTPLQDRIASVSQTRQYRNAVGEQRRVNRGTSTRRTTDIVERIRQLAIRAGVTTNQMARSIERAAEQGGRGRA